MLRRPREALWRSRVGGCEAAKRGLRESWGAVAVPGGHSRGCVGHAAGVSGVSGCTRPSVTAGSSRGSRRRWCSAPFCPSPAAVPAPRVPRPPAVRRKSQDGGGGSPAPPPLPTPGPRPRSPVGLSSPAPPPRARPRQRPHRPAPGHAPIVPPLPRRSFLLPGRARTPPPRMAGPAPPQL